MTAQNSYIQKTDAFMTALGVEAYRVGGSVRDEILGRRVKDADYVVRGRTLEQLRADLVLGLRAHGDPKGVIKPLSDRDNRPLGWRVAAKGLGLIEITLPRKEISTGPGHRDFDIVLDPELPLGEDAKRRDFTFNALYKAVSIDGTGLVTDPTNRGLYDLEHKLINTTHPDSFRDDPLRILRALRFASVLGYNLTGQTRVEMAEHADAVNGLTVDGNISGTVLDEMSKLLMGDDVADTLRLAASTGVLGTLFPELEPMIGFDQGSKYHDMTTDEHTFVALATAAKCEAPLRVRWALLFHDAGKPAVAWVGEDRRKHYYAHPFGDFKVGMVDPFDGHLNEDHEIVSERLWRETAGRMNAPARLREDVATLIREHMVSSTGKVKGSKVRRARVRLGDEMLRDLHMHRMCDLSGKGKSNRNHLLHIAQQEDLRREAQAAGVPASVKDLHVTGKDAVALGLEGAAIGDALRGVLDEVVVDPSPRNLTRDWQLESLGRAV